MNWAKQKRALVWVASFVPVIPVLMVLYANHVPAEARRDLRPLAGEWKVQAGDDPAWARPEQEDASWKVITLPGLFLPQGVSGGRAWVRKWVELSPGMEQQDLFLCMGDSRSGFVRAFVNGHFVGEQGAAAGATKVNLNELFGWTVPKQFLVPGKNLIALRFEWLVPGYDGTTDARLYLGADRTLKPFFLKATMVESVLTLGPPFLFVFVLVVLLGFLFTEDLGELRRRWLATIVLAAGSGFYLCLRAGIVTPLFLTIPMRVRLVPFAGMFVVCSMLEFYEDWYLRRVTWVCKVNRVLFLVGATAALVVPLGPRLFALYRIIVVWWLVICAATLLLCIHSLVTKKRVLSPILLIHALVFAVCFCADVLTDVRVISVQRSLPFVLSDIGIVASIVVLGDFFRISADNKRFAASLTVANQELAQALVDAKESARLKGEFLANVSHELRTPLNAIINLPRGMVDDFLRPPWMKCAGCGTPFQLEPGEEVDPGAPCPICAKVGTLSPQAGIEYAGDAAASYDHLQTIRRNGSHLLGVVNQILDASKLESGKMQLEPEEVSLGTLLEDAHLTVQPLAAKRGIRVSIPREGTDFLVRLDTVKVVQVLINLLSNAVRFSPDNGEVVLQLEDEGKTFVLKVVDTGIGIAPENHAVIFESFRQVEGGATRKFGGTGLGLAITRQLVELHGGKIWLESALGSGSTFFVRLPKVVEIARRPAAVPVGAADSVILVVDDEPLVAETIRLALRETPYKVVGVTDPRATLQAVNQLSPRLVILDVMMPRKSGITVLQEIQGLGLQAPLPVLVLSAHHANQAVVTSMGASWMAKPWNPAALIVEINRLVGDKQKVAE